jgi:NAD(P)H dehydrogenase (quinone)
VIVGVTPTKQRALWVYAHPDGKSFNRQLLIAGRTELGRTHDVVTTDLYAERFDPVLSQSDLGSHAGVDDTFLNRWATAYSAGELPPEIRAQQQKLLAADLVVLQFPLWWYGLPAILKGWIDRVFTSGFGFDLPLGPDRLPQRYGAGLLAGKRAFVIVSAGETAAALGPRGLGGDIDTLMFGLTHGVLWYTGVAAYPLHVIADADDLDAAAVQREIDRLAHRITGLDKEDVIPYRRLDSGDYRPGRVLRADLAPGRIDLGLHLRTAHDAAGLQSCGASRSDTARETTVELSRPVDCECCDPLVARMDLDQPAAQSRPPCRVHRG